MKKLEGGEWGEIPEDFWNREAQLRLDMILNEIEKVSLEQRIYLLKNLIDDLKKEK